MIQESHSRYISKGKEIMILKRFPCSHVHSSIFHKSHRMGATYTSVDGRMNEENVVYIYDGTLFNLKTEENPVICNIHG